MLKVVRCCLLLIVTAGAVEAATRYEFRSVSSGPLGTTVAGRAFVDTAGTRLEITEGDGFIFPDGSVAISRAGSSLFQLVQPAARTWYELDVAALSGASILKSLGGGTAMTIANTRVNVRDLGNGGVVEGYPTRRYMTESSYDLIMKVLGAKQTVRIASRTETWATEKLPASLATVIQTQNLRTGFPKLDAVIERESRAVRGFPLRQVRVITTTSGKRKQSFRVETTIRAIAPITLTPAAFQIPEGFRKIKPPLLGRLAGAA